VLNVQGLHTEYVSDKGVVVKAAQDVSFEVPEGKLFTLLGPSGCGKTTTLRSIAGLEKPTSGLIKVNGETVFSAGQGSDKGVFVQPNKRGFGMVFQSYAIWPHMTVFQNASFPLEVGQKKYSKQEIQTRVMKVLESVELAQYHDRDATRLSGGQQQRLALARALVMEPKLLLLDEPLSNLDSKLREKMRFELKKIQRELGITTIYVTHDQSEALALSHQIAVMRNGRIVQLGTPREIYESPNSEFVADFVGTINFIKATVRMVDASTRLMVVDSEIGVIQVPMNSDHSVGDSVHVCVRPEDIFVGDEASVAEETHGNHYGGIVSANVFLGDVLDFQVKVNEKTLLVRVHPSQKAKVDAPIKIQLKPSACIVLKTHF
jgi:iron(III) transport system ATP-binding protein